MYQAQVQPNAFALNQGNQAPKPPTAPQVNPYDDFRKQAQLRNQAQMQTQQNALQRRFAQLGGGPSGAQMKMEQDVQRQGADDLSNQIGSINAQEAQAQQAQNQFQQQFGLQQDQFGVDKLKTLAGIDMARRQQALDEQGQLFNQANEVITGPYRMQGDPFAAYNNGINIYRNYLNNNQGAANFGGYYNQLQALSDPMTRRLMAPQQQTAVMQKQGGVA